MDSGKSESHINKGFQAVILVSQCSIPAYFLYVIQSKITEYQVFMSELHAIIADA